MTPREKHHYYIARIAKRRGLSVEDVLSKKRHPELVSVRRYYSRILRRSKYELTVIARILRRDHSTIHHLLKSQDRVCQPRRPKRPYQRRQAT